MPAKRKPAKKKTERAKKPKRDFSQIALSVAEQATGERLSGTQRKP